LSGRVRIWRRIVSATQSQNQGRANSAEFGQEFDLSHNHIKSFYISDLVWLGRQDSNLGSRDQSPLPYRLATPQSVRHKRTCRQTARPAVPSPSSVLDEQSGLSHQIWSARALLPASDRTGNLVAGHGIKLPALRLRGRGPPSICRRPGTSQPECSAAW
jgi:hypothetical protein